VFARRLPLGLSLGGFVGGGGGSRLEEEQGALGEVGVSLLEPSGDDRRGSLRLGDDVLLLRAIRVLLDRGDGGGGLATRSLEERTRREVLGGDLGGEPDDPAAFVHGAL
jgi:hypothetical protein